MGRHEQGCLKKSLKRKKHFHGSKILNTQFQKKCALFNVEYFDN